MKIAHIVHVTPGACGMYETARDLVIAERAVGIDARLVDIRGHVPILLEQSTVRPGTPCPN